MFLLPQLEGLDVAPAVDVFRILTRALEGLCSREQRDEFALRFADLFPHVPLPMRHDSAGVAGISRRALPGLICSRRRRCMPHGRGRRPSFSPRSG